MGLFLESRAGQNETAKWYQQLSSQDGQEKRFASTPKEFWCMELQAGKTTRSFRDGLEGKQYSVILASTNCSKLEGIQEGAQVEYDGGRRNVVSADYDKVKKLWILALS